MVEGVDPACEAVGIAVHDQVGAHLGNHSVAECVHFRELPRGVDVQQRKGQPTGVERLAREVQHHRTVLADRIQHHRTLRFGDRLAQDVDRLPLQAL